MKFRHLTVLMLAAAIGCTQGSAPPEVVDSGIHGAELTAGMDLPDPSSSLIKFVCPGMT